MCQFLCQKTLSGCLLHRSTSHQHLQHATFSLAARWLRPVDAIRVSKHRFVAIYGRFLTLFGEQGTLLRAALCLLLLRSNPGIPVGLCMGAEAACCEAGGWLSHIKTSWCMGRGIGETCGSYALSIEKKVKDCLKRTTLCCQYQQKGINLQRG